MLNLSFLNKDNGVDIDFDPELVMISLDSGKVASIRVASGDENNINKNVKLDMSDVKIFTLNIEGFDEYENPPLGEINRDSVLYITGNAFLEITKNDSDEVKRQPLVEHRIGIFPQKTKVNGKTAYVFPDLKEVESEIKMIWNDVFAESLADFMMADSENSAPPTRKKKAAGGFSLVSKICVGLMIASLLIFAFGYFNKQNNVQTSGQETILGVYDEINNMPETDAAPVSQNSEITPDQEAMAEFGLEEGIKLD